MYSPEFAPQVSIQTEAPGLTPEQIEALVTQPIEWRTRGSDPAIFIHPRTLRRHRNLRSGKQALLRDRGLVAERFAVSTATSRRDPAAADAAEPRPAPFSFSGSHPTSAPLWICAPLPIGPCGRGCWPFRVSQKLVFGGETRSIQVAVNPDELIRYNLRFNEVLGAARRLPGIAARFIDTANQRIRARASRLKQTRHRPRVLVSEGALSLRLGNVADVVDAPEPPIGGPPGGGQGVILVVSAQYGADALEVTRLVEDTLADFTMGTRAGWCSASCRSFFVPRIS